MTMKPLGKVLDDAGLLDYETPVEHGNGYMSAPIPVMFTYLPWDALFEVAKCFTENCKTHGGKYPKDNWRRCESYTIMLEGVLSHVHRLLVGEGDEKEHLVHITTRCLMMLSLYLNEHR
jgi:hypothetical protein